MWHEVGARFMKCHQSLTASSTSCSRTKVAPHALHFAFASSYVYVGLWLPYKRSLSMYTFQFPALVQSEEMSVPSYSQLWLFIAQFCACGQPTSAGLKNKMENHTLASYLLELVRLVISLPAHSSWRFWPASCHPPSDPARYFHSTTSVGHACVTLWPLWAS